MSQAKKGRAKPKHKQTGKKRSKGKQSCAKKVAVVQKVKEDSVRKKYIGNLEDYEPVRKHDSDEEMIESDEGDLEVFQQPHTDFKFLTSIDLQE